MAGKSSWVCLKIGHLFQWPSGSSLSQQAIWCHWKGDTGIPHFQTHRNINHHCHHDPLIKSLLLMLHRSMPIFWWWNPYFSDGYRKYISPASCTCVDHFHHARILRRRGTGDRRRLCRRRRAGEVPGRPISSSNQQDRKVISASCLL